MDLKCEKDWRYDQKNDRCVSEIKVTGQELIKAEDVSIVKFKNRQFLEILLVGKFLFYKILKSLQNGY